MLIDEKAIITGVARLREKGVPFAEGLTNTEIEELEGRYRFVFPLDLRYFLQLALPISPYFVNWRDEPNKLSSWLRRPVEGILFDVIHNTFWFPEWGPRPEEAAEALMVAERKLAEVPTLIPIGDQIFPKCIPASPTEAGNPVFSIHQTDILHAGRDLGDFLRWLSRPREECEHDEAQGIDPTPVFCADYRPIAFWTELTRQNTST